jgi:hypothetical protein
MIYVRLRKGSRSYKQNIDNDVNNKKREKYEKDKQDKKRCCKGI